MALPADRRGSRSGSALGFGRGGPQLTGCSGHPRAPTADIRGGDAGDEVGPDHGLGGGRPADEFDFVEDLGGDDPADRAAFANAPGQSPGVYAADAHDAEFAEEVGQARP